MPQVLLPDGEGDFAPITRALLKRYAVAVYGGRLADEYSELRRFRRLLLEWDRQGILRREADDAVVAMTRTVIEEDCCESDDEHIIALARVSKSRLLCSHDKELHADFTNPKILRPRGDVYQNPNHRHLIRKHCRQSRYSRRTDRGDRVG
ncbi:MAG TPA: hypothetical protein VML55_14160 [Planctomycetaceae bacterium]|nr:hypothetical protein [Planctomycetaceae bacterium]